MNLTALAGPIPSLEELAVPIISDIDEGPPDIIPGLLPKAGELVIAGQTDIGKSLIALEICSSLVTGNPLWGELTPTVQAKRVLYCLSEHYIGVIQRLHRVTKLPLTDQVFILGPEQLGYDKWLVTQAKPNLQALNKFKHWAEGCDLIVFDPLAAFVTGGEGIENDNVVMRLVLDSMSLIAQQAGASCLVLAHQGKPQMDRDGTERSRKSYAIRGASGIEDAATNIFYMDKAVDTMSNQAQKVAGDALIINLMKRKYKGTAPDCYRLMRDPVTLTHTLLGNRPYAEVLKLATNAKVNRLQAIGTGWRDAVRLVAAMEGVPESTIRRHLGVDG